MINKMFNQPFEPFRVYFYDMRLVLLFIFLPLISIGQKWIGQTNTKEVDNRKARMIFSNEILSTDTSKLKQFLEESLDNLKNSELQFSNVVQSPKAKHFLFHQTANGRQVFRGSVKLNVANSGKVLSIFDNTYEINTSLDSDFPNHQPYHDGLMVHYETPDNGILDHYTLKEVYYPQNGTLIPAIHLEVVEKTNRYYELVLNKDVQVIYQNDLLSYSEAPPDSTVTLWAFNPDPLTPTNQAYGAPYADADDSDIVELNAERIPVTATATFQDGSFLLENDYVAIRELSPPTVAPVASVTPEFNYTRSEAGFEDVNAFYHITFFQNYIQSLGFSNIVNYPIEVDPHALNGSDNSNFNGGFNPPRLQFGEGGVDDAEDADVIIHEYGHAIMHSAAPGSNSGTERRALDEAIGDYFAASYSRFLSPNRWEDVFTWDGHNEFWPGRSAVSDDHYPEDLASNIYADADIWSATLMQIWGDIGREATDAIMIQSGYSYSENMTMTQAAMLFLQADTLLFDGDNFTPIHQRMFSRGLIPWLSSITDEVENRNFDVFNTAGFTSGNEPTRVISDFEIRAVLYNSLGQEVGRFTSASGNLEVNSNGLKAGVYLLSVTSNNQTSTIKLVKH